MPLTLFDPSFDPPQEIPLGARRMTALGPAIVVGIDLEQQQVVVDCEAYGYGAVASPGMIGGALVELPA
jgi:hypothetical protein